jgi:Ca-activated chloride channel family protein
MPGEIFNEELLKNIANQTGGLYFRGTDKEQLQQIFTEIERFGKTQITTQRYYHAKGLYMWFILGAFAILFLVEIGKRSVLHSLP